MLILRKVLNSLMTCCVSYFVATLTPYISYMWFIRFYRPSSFPGPPVVSLDLTWPHLTSLGLRFVGQVDSFLFLDLQFLHPVVVHVSWTMSVLKAVVSFYRTGEERPIERYKARLKVQEEHRTLSTFKKNVIDFLGLNEQARKFGLGSFDLKLYRLAKISGKIENYSLSTQQQLDLELPLLLYSDSESELNSKYS